MKTLVSWIAISGVILLGAVIPVSAEDCGPRPVPGPNCMIGRCIEGEWEQVCAEDPFSTCGMKPLPASGCEITECLEGRWIEVCHGVLVTPEAPEDCGLKPLPPAGCTIGACVYGQWEMNCF